MEDMSMNTNGIVEINPEVDETSDSSCGAIVAGFAGGMVAYFITKGASKAWAWTKRMMAKRKLKKLEPTEETETCEEEDVAES